MYWVGPPPANRRIVWFYQGPAEVPMLTCGHCWQVAALPELFGLSYHSAQQVYTLSQGVAQQPSVWKENRQITNMLDPSRSSFFRTGLPSSSPKNPKSPRRFQHTPTPYPLISSRRVSGSFLHVPKLLFGGMWFCE